MMKYMMYFSVLLLSISAISCDNVTGVKETDFAIYTLKNEDQSLTDVADQALENVTIAPQPVINIYELHSYEWHSHTMILTSQVGSTLEQMVHPDSTNNQHPFVLMAGGERIYMGAFLPAWSSLKPNMPHIPLTSSLGDSVITLTIHKSADRDGDVREDMRIYEALKAGGKLVE